MKMAIRHETWISGQSSTLWHIAREDELRGAKTGKVMGRSLVAACNGKTLGGAWGASKLNHRPLNPANICPRCAKLASGFVAKRVED